ncbi:protein-lysine N-trimethyltransferase SMYD5 isoform X1 [Physeter macrocephalus]|uniref:Protein-lysine N-trimethyltransferase SMYD5 n=1 Tax=Physeter macrocephalus TaxID=9755 RepID=A0A2Y9EV74_PHYMC|nr:histone-lysine N-trimethyltransferase SMYD5 isoform X1 [Physeter catodon]|eukprot:XP_007109725.1 SET and MYND domain-containing protein 5 isoform X1 [Physeter catodon]
MVSQFIAASLQSYSPLLSLHPYLSGLSLFYFFPLTSSLQPLSLPNCPVLAFYQNPSSGRMSWLPSPCLQLICCCRRITYPDLVTRWLILGFLPLHSSTCDHCLRALEKAEENAQRLTGKPGQVLPHPELCTVRKDLHQNCPHCQVTYCSTECLLAAAEQYHQVLCPGPSQDDPLHPLNKLQEAWRSVHYPPETASIMLMARMVATVKQAKDKDRWIRLFSQFCNKTANEEEEIVHKLLGDKFKGQLELLRRLFTEALYEEALSQWFTPDGFRSLFALVGTNGQGIGTSSLSQWVHACDALELKPQDREELDAFIDQLYKDIEAATGEFLNCEGSGLFVLQSCCNHSCVPNAETSFPENNFLLHVTALEDIKPGEEICISYLDCCQRERSRHSRHKILRENYLFVCSCPKCLAEADEPNMTSEEEDDEEDEEGEPEDAELGDEMTDV